MLDIKNEYVEYPLSFLPAHSFSSDVLQSVLTD